MTTAADIIKLALKDCGVLDETEEPSAALMSDALTTLNQMLALWSVQKLFVYAQIDTTKAATGSSTYTIGVGGDFNTRQPSRIDYAFLRENNIDYPIDILNNFEEYQEISVKGVSGTWPEVLYFNPTNSLGIIYFYPQPISGTIHLISSIQLPSYTSHADAINIPGEYEIAIRFSLAEILHQMMGANDSRPGLSALANKARMVIRRMNVKIKKLDLGGNGSRGYLPIIGDW
jgi:hypothetical protein